MSQSVCFPPPVFMCMFNFAIKKPEWKCWKFEKKLKFCKKKKVLRLGLRKSIFARQQ